MHRSGLIGHIEIAITPAPTRLADVVPEPAAAAVFFNTLDLAPSHILQK